MRTLCIVLVTTCGVGHAQWTRTSAPSADYTWALAANGQTLFMGSSHGLWRSTDEGMTWSHVTAGLGDTVILSLCAYESVVCAGTSRGVFRSTTNGLSWEQSDTATLKDAITVLSRGGDDLFAGTVSQGVFRSTNLGISWEARTSGIADTYILSFATGTGSLYAGTSGLGVFVSTNEGETWSAMESGVYPVVRGLTVKDEVVFAGGAAGAFRNSSGGGWAMVNDGLTHTFIRGLLAHGPDLFAWGWGGIHRSTDDGATWTNMSEGLPDTSVQAFILAGSQAYIAVDSLGVWSRPLDQVLTSVPHENREPIPFVAQLDQNFPNPFNPMTTLRYRVFLPGNARLTVFDLHGQTIANWMADFLPSGTHETIWDASAASSGMYFYRLTVVGTDGRRFVETRKMVHLK